MRNAGIVLGLALVGISAAPAAVSDKTLVIGEGIGGVKMGMTRDEVVAAAGKPLEENANGVLSYESSTGNRIFDVYLDQGKKTPTVRLIIQAGKGFRTSAGIDIYAKGALRKLKKAYPRMKFVKQDTDTDQSVWRVKTRKAGTPVWTDFVPGSTRGTLGARVIETTVLLPQR